MAYKVLIVDDEVRTRSLLANMLSHNSENLKVYSDGESVATAIASIEQQNPDIVLLDIQLPDGSGFDILDRLDDRDFQVIFITAHEEYAIRAIKSSALDYILKPVDEEELNNAIYKAVNRIKGQLDQSTHYDALLNNIEKDNKKIVLRTLESLYIFDVEDIVRCQSSGNYTNFYINDDREIIVSKPLKEYEEALAYRWFVRCHRSHIINMDYVDRFDKNDGGAIIMRDGTKVPLSRSFRERFFEALENMT